MLKSSVHHILDLQNLKQRDAQFKTQMKLDLVAL